MKWTIVLLLMLTLGMSFAGLSVENFSLTKSVYSPNEPGVATVTVSNPIGSERVSAITMTIQNPPEIQVTSAPKMSDIDAGGSAIVSIPFRVSDNARPGIYLLNVQFAGYKSVGATGSSQTSINTVSIPITVVNEPELSFTVDRTVLSSIDTVRLTISNNGGQAKSAKLTTVGTVSLYGSDQIYLGELTGNKTVDLTLDSRDAQDGPTDVVLKLNYEDELGIPIENNVTIRMTVRNERLDLTFSQESDIITKKEGALKLSVRNDGTETLRDIRLSFPNDSIRIKDSDEIKFGDLKPGESATATATVFAELPPGVNLVASELSWIERDVQKEGSRQLPLTISSDADVGVYLEAKPLPLTIGTEHTISVLVSNLGSYPIENVDVGIKSPALSSLDLSDKQYIGGLQSDDFSTVQFLMKTNATAEGDYPVSVTVNYRDQSGEWKQRVITQMISVHNGVVTEQSPLPLIAGGFGLLLVLWYFKFRKA
ncbi:MAG: hypothetical protein V1861_05345 [Candidatus Micrarchaeota archaeon]